MKNNKGFSLVELIIVIAIMVILVAVIAPQYTKFVQKSRVSGDVNTAADIATAIDVAIASGETVFGSNSSITSVSLTNLPALPVSKQAGNDDSWVITGDDTDGVKTIKLDKSKAADSGKRVSVEDLYPSTETGSLN